MSAIKVKISDLANDDFLGEMANILNRGNEVKVKIERGDYVVLVEEKRTFRHKIHIDKDY